MSKKFRLVAIIIALVLVLSMLTACDQRTECEKNGHQYNEFGICTVCGETNGTFSTYAEGTELKVSIAHNSAATTITFEDSNVIPEGGLTLADGKTYQVGDLKPVWAELQSTLKVTFNNVYKSGDVQTSYRNWRTDNFEGVDVLLGNAADIAEDGKKGALVNLANYLEYMPNFKAFLEENPLVLLSIISDTDTGAIYYAPYFDGYNDIERYFLMRSDWVEKLLDGKGAFTAETYDVLGETVYTPYMPTSGKVVVDALTKDGSAVTTITKDYDAAGNPISNQAKLTEKNGVTLVNALRDYIDKAYNGYYGEKRSDLFCGYDAAWDADELVALLRCVTTNTFTLTGQNETKVTGIFPRETRLDREANLLGIASMFGARGLTSTQDYLYFDSEGNLQDARSDADFYDAVGKLNELYKEGLILQDFDTYANSKIYLDMYQKNLGFMTWDYCQTQTLYNEYSNPTKAEGFNLTPVLNPVAKYDDGSGDYFRFTESWRSVKTQGWCISATVANDKDKLAAALALFDYPWSEEGSVMMTYGPAAFLDGTTEYKGEQVPKMNAQNLADFARLGKGNFTDFARKYIGTTFGIGFVKDQGFEYQCTTEGGRIGSLKVGQAIALGVVRHVTPEINEENMFYTMVPTTLPTTAEEDTTIQGLTALRDNFSKTNKQYGCYVDLIKNGFGGAVKGAISPLTQLPSSAEAMAELVNQSVNKGGMGGALYLELERGAWDSAFAYYEANIK